MASLINVRLNRGDASPWGFRLQGGKDFGTPLLIQKVNGNSLAEKAGLQVGDAVIRVNGTDVFNLRHKDAQDIIVRGGNNIEVTVQRGGNATWKPAVTPVGSTPKPTAHLPSKPSPVTKTSLSSTRPQAPSNIGSAHNLAPRPFSSPQVNGEPVKSIVNKQYNTPVNIYSEETIAETLSAQAEVLAGGVLGVNFKKNEKGYDAEKSEVYKMLLEAEKEPKSPEPVRASTAFYATQSHAIGGRAVSPRPVTPIAQQMLPPQTAPYIPQTAAHTEAPKCSDCNKFIVGVFVRIKDKNLHVECFKCATCGTSLKNVGYYNINNKLYCDVHAKLVARHVPPQPNLEPITIPPGGRAPAGTISAALSNTTAPSSAGPQSPQPSTIAPVPFHQQQSSPSTTAASTGAKPFSGVSAPAPRNQPAAAPYQPPAAPYQPPVAPPAPSAPFYTKQQPALPPSNKFVWPPNEDNSQPAATATPLYIPPACNSDTTAPVEKSTPELSSPDDHPALADKGKRMSICSEEICEIVVDKKNASKSDNLISVTEESGDRPESPVPFCKQDSMETTPQKEIQSLDISLQNVNLEEKTDATSLTQNLAAESLKVSAKQGASSSQNVETTVEGGVTRTRKTKVEESFSHSSTSYSSLRSSKTISRCITPEICEIMDKPRGSPSLLPPELDRPATPQQVVVFPPEIPLHIPIPRSRTSTPQPHALQRILSEELGLKLQQPPVPVEEIKTEKTESIKSSEELFKKTQVDEVVQNEIKKYKSEDDRFDDEKKIEIQSDRVDRSNKSEEIEIEVKKPDESSGIINQNAVESKLEIIKQKEVENSIAQSSTTQRFESSKFEQAQITSMQSIQVDKEAAMHLSNQKENEIKTSSQTDVFKTGLSTSAFGKKEERPYSPVQPPRAIVRPKPQPVPLPPETKPYYPPPPPPSDESEPVEKPKRLGREQACSSPMVAALTTAPNRPYSPLPVPTFKPISLDDLPSPTQGSQPLSLLSALTIAPDSPYSPFPEPVDVSKQSPPKFFKDNSKSTSFTQFSESASNVVSIAKSTQANVSTSTASKTTTESAFKPVVQKPQNQSQPQPLPIPKDVKASPSVPNKSFPPVSDELKSSFAFKSQANAIHSTSSTQNLSASSQTSQRISPSSFKKPDLLPYYQQNIGEIPLAHRPKSPVPHAIKAPMYKSATEQKRTVSDQIKTSSTLDSNRGSGYISSSNYVSSSVYGKTFTSAKEEIRSLESSKNHIPYYQQSTGEIPLTHRPKSPTPHSIKAPAYKAATEQKSTVSDQIKTSSSFVSSRSSNYVASSVYGQTFTSTKEETQAVEGSGNLLPYYQQNIGEIPLAHRPKSPVPHAIKAPSIEPIKPARSSSTQIKPSPLAGKAPETLSKSKQVFKPETRHQNVFSAPPETIKPLHKTLPHFSSHPTSTSTSDSSPGGAPWIVKKQSDISSHPSQKPIQNSKLPDFSSQTTQKPIQTPKPPDFKSGAVSSQKPVPQTDHKPAAGFTPPSQIKPPGPPTTSVPPAGAGGPGSKGATFAGSTAPRRGRGTLNPSVGPGARIPLCGSCSRQIRGPFITALGKIWCPEHFMCANEQCRRPLQDIGFVEESTGLYCEYCFEQYLAPNCNKCGNKIKGDCLNAIGKHFHPECFCCAYCGKLFGNSPFFLEDALPYCESDWNDLFTTKCFSCGFPIEAGDRWVEALSNNYHSQCFNCTMCKKNLEGQSFYAKGGRPFCKNHAR
ncbi:Z band alternatively spliced PDZ-motif protein 52 isoform X3 [Lycorma delicatula]|uniref:Z band alternatively spliced PDZ-motif protein 52 isoform X3 n=1 Tax=Lycorma delicatula TaxID=130591 RepID=UPI003F50FC38